MTTKPGRFALADTLTDGLREAIGEATKRGLPVTHDDRDDDSDLVPVPLTPAAIWDNFNKLDPKVAALRARLKQAPQPGAED